MTTTFNLPDVLTVAVKDVGLLTFETNQWASNFVVAAVSYAVRIKVDQQRNKEHKSPEDKRAAIDDMVATLRKGEWAQRATVAATLDETERQLRSLIASQFAKAGQKKTEAAKLATQVNRWDLVRDLVIKKKIAEVATDKAELEQLMQNLQQRADNAKVTLENTAARNAEIVLKMLEENDPTI